jgi:hypothetical protein
VPELERRTWEQYGISAKVKPFTTDPQELAAELRGADVVLMPSRNEAFGLVAFEAAGHGVPILVGSNSGAGVFLEQRVPEHLGKPSVVPMVGLERDLPDGGANHIERVVDDLHSEPGAGDGASRAPRRAVHLERRWRNGWPTGSKTCQRREPSRPSWRGPPMSLNRANEATAARQDASRPSGSPNARRSLAPSGVAHSAANARSARSS